MSWRNKICIYKTSNGKWDMFTNWLWFYVCEKNKLWAKIIYYPIDWCEQRSFDISCLIERHFYINSETECERCGKVKTSK